MPSRVARRKLPPAVARQQEIVDALVKLGPRGLAQLERELREASRQAEVTYIRRPGKVDVIRTLTAPAVLARGDAPILRSIVLAFLSAFRKVAAARPASRELKLILPLEPAEEEWLALAPPPGDALVARWDLRIDPAAGGARAAQLFEMNGCAVGGLLYGPASSNLLIELVVPLAGGRPLVAPESMSTLWWKTAVAHARARGRAGQRLAWLEDRSWETGITEGPSLVARLVSEGHGAVLADPRELVVDGDEIRYQGLPLDVLYRAIELADLVAIEAEARRPLTAMREAVRRGLVLSPLEADLDHKSLLEAFTSTAFARLFTREERAVLRRHVPWTRLLGARRTDGPDGREIDLPEYARKQRAKLVLKPNRACGGDGVLIGRDTPATTWERAIARALSGKEPAVVQALVDGATTRSPAVVGGRIKVERHYTTFGVFATDDGVGILGRAAPFPVVNVSRGGGLLGVLLL